MGSFIKDWVDYWCSDGFWKNSLLWEINTTLFFKKANRILEFKKNDNVLDIGCGAGYTEQLLSPLVDRMCAVDVAQQFIDLCSERCAQCANVHTKILNKENYTHLEELKGPFSIILCVSVVQYYKSEEEIEALISSAREVAAPGAKMLIADLPLKRNVLGFVWDAVCSFVLSLRGGYAPILMKTAFKRWAQRTSYRDFYNKTRQLYFSRQQLEALVERMNLDAKIIRADFSVYANRLSLLIQF